ncbi:MAG: PAC2 family protein [Candidatus Aenigmarchaeota archaeon]|nr:PAC2 family protein [Candidatus Aenigmarchaeota archaeon]MDW8149785.1 PAC2 family protein [Candidatus Aenigmarchaeota archaeon]
MIEVIEIPKIKNSVVFISGFSGTGNVGLLSAKILEEKLKAKLIAKIYSFDFPPISIINDKEVELPCVKIFNKNNILIAYSEFQPNLSIFQYLISKELIRFTENFKIKYFISLGAMILDYLNETPEAYFYTNSTELEKILLELKIKSNQKFSTIVGCNGLNYAFSVKNNYKSALILVDTYRFFEYDYNGAKKLVEILCKLLNISIDLSDINKLIEDQKREYKELLKKFEVRKSEREEKEKLSYIG